MKARYLTVSLVALVLTLASTSAFANDQLISTVTPVSGQYSSVIPVTNGVANGNIRLNYVYVGSSLPCGDTPFATFTLGLQDVLNTNTKLQASYPIALTLAQSGNGTPVQFAIDPSTIDIYGGQSYASAVTVNIDCNKLAALGSPYDGETIDGQFNESTPNGSHLDTISTVQVHITLSIPSPTACLKVYSFETDQDTGTLLPGVTVVESTNKFGTSVKSTNPGTISVDGLVVNYCSTPETFDLGIGGVGPGSMWQTIPSNNPGNATFSYTVDGDADNPYTSFSLASFGTGTGQREVVCLPDVTVNAGSSYLVTVHSTSNIPQPPTGPGNFTFSASLYNPSSSPSTISGCQQGPFDISIANPNSASSSLPYTVKSN